MGVSQLHVLYEHASGYALLRVSEFEELGQLSAACEAACNDISRFQALVKLVAFSPFRSSTGALENCNAVSESLLHEDLKAFLTANLPSGSQLGVGEWKFRDAVKEELGIDCCHNDAIREIMRCAKQHLPRMVKGLTVTAEGKAQIGLGHSYSRLKVKFNVHRADNMIIQSINMLDQMDKDVNTFCMRIREWYGYHFPELVKLSPDNPTYVQLVKLIGSRKEFLARLDDDLIAQLEEVIKDGAKAAAVVEAARSSMGMNVSELDLLNIRLFTSRVENLLERRAQMHAYLADKLQLVAPNLSSLIGDQVAARLISHAGSLTNLAKFPASTVQILGAEKALFRALKTRGNTPKYGLIFHSSFIGKAARENKGKISRFLASKASIASRIDCFSEVPHNVFGLHLKKQIEDRLKFFETGAAPPKNHEVMNEAVSEADTATQQILRKQRKKERKRRKEAPAVEEEAMEQDEASEQPKKKKKKKKSAAAPE